MRTHTRTRIIVGAAALATTGLLVSGCTGGGGSGGGGGNTVSVMGTWSGAEQDSFLAMVAPWEEETGYTVEYTGSRDINAQITAGMASGNLPDVAGIPGPGQVQEWYDAGALQPLDFLDAEAYEDSTPGGFAELGTVDGKLAGVFTKATVKGLVFYNTAVWSGDDPATYDDMLATADSLKTGDETTWCVGLESGAASGWPGTDWIENILLRQSGPDVYDRWASGELEWTSPEVKEAFETFGDVLADSFGGSDFVVNTNFGRAGNPLFSSPPGCLLHQQATFITDFFQNEAGATPDQYAFFRFPDMNSQFTGAVTGGGDIVGMFNDTEAARSLIEYLITPEAQDIWAKRGGFLAANLNVPLDSYPDEINRKSAEILQAVEVFRFDASDTMPAAVSDAFNRAMVSFAQNPGDLDAILGRIESARQDAAS